MKEFGTDENVKIDLAHANLLTALVQTQKPQSVLEIGLGGGQSADAILAGLKYNQQEYTYTLVDNWFDWNGQQPAGVAERYEPQGVKIIVSDERDFVFATDQTFDFIMSDGDHMRAEQWFEYVYSELLNPGGILIYHDINLFDSDAFQNLTVIYEKCQEYKLRYNLFNRNSLPTERCQRGLLVIFKD